ncbi:TIGR02922 family protein [Thalassomonas sp. M1454]|uniref:TIGR02922 family protein n=1 Tax=Thalassomonas sp. M1454 TaxID=2594477 RepID=UPI00117CB5BE|nr:TIGR02922 family protein [Thalassomonas sp. M1454]TRX56627.1 TIGR02922 family protein [Thalassomonas sp. M1454]
MTKVTLRKVSILYYDIASLELNHSVEHFPQRENGRVIISDEFKKNKSIIAVCDGEINVLNKIGDRVSEQNVAKKA